jgi:hypothetical protein
LNRGLFDEYEGFVYVERTLAGGGVRRGLVCAVDLECYSFEKGNTALIRASEGTVLERIPPRVKIRESSPLELPHIMILIDDESRSVIEPLGAADLPLLYDFKLNLGGGAVKGRLVKDAGGVLAAANALLTASRAKYGSQMLMAVGDGNHSLAAAKRVWENEKAIGGHNTAARYCLVEIVSVYDEALRFEPIHRIVFCADGAGFIAGLNRAALTLSEPTGSYRAYFDGGEYNITLPRDSVKAVDFAERFITDYIAKNGGGVEYVHGESELKSIAAQKKSGVGIALKKMNKSEFFPYVARFGALPKNTFSMGEAEDKRYYLEARLIK